MKNISLLKIKTIFFPRESNKLVFLYYFSFKNILFYFYCKNKYDFLFELGISLETKRGDYEIYGKGMEKKKKINFWMKLVLNQENKIKIVLS